MLYRIEVRAASAPGSSRAGGMDRSRSPPGGNLMVFLHQTATSPPEIWRATLDGKGQRALTALNREALAQLDLTALEPFGFVGAGGLGVRMAAQAPRLRSEKTYPLVYLIHGGPAERLGRRMARPLELRDVRGPGVRGGGGQLPWVDRLRPPLHQQHLAQLGRAPLRGSHEGARCPGIPPVHRQGADRRRGGFVRRLHDLLDGGHTTRFRRWSRTTGFSIRSRWLGRPKSSGSPLGFGGSQLSPAARALMEKWSPANYISQLVHADADRARSARFPGRCLGRVSGLHRAQAPWRPRQVPVLSGRRTFRLKPRNRRFWWGTVLDWFDSLLR